MNGYAVLWAEDFALQSLRRADPALARGPVALVRGEGRKAVAAEVSLECAGLPAGLPAALALARCPGLILRPRDIAAEGEAQNLLIAAAFTLSPRVEATAAGCCTVDLQGADPSALERQSRLLVLELARAGLAVRIGISTTPLLAGYAARLADPVRVVPQPREFLAPLPLAFAEPAPGQAEVLEQWGVRTLGQLTALPKAEIGRRLGADGIALWERAAGETERVLRLAEPARTFAMEWAYEPPVEAMEPLLFRLRRFAERLALELRGAGLAAAALTLTLLLEDGTDYRREFTLPEPNTDLEGWLRVLHGHLEAVRTAARVIGVRFAAAPTRAPEKQDSLFDTGLRDPQAFWESLARVGAIVGEGRVGTPRPADSRRPDAFSLERPAPAIPPAEQPPVHPSRGPVLRRFRPAWPVRVALESGRPAGLEGDEIRGRIEAVRGPWRASGDWWRPQAWAVETWQVEMAGGGIYQLTREGAEWRVAGILRLMSYVELHARSAFSFLRGGSSPESLMSEAARLGLPALALCDRDGVYGAARLFTRARETGGRALVGCELTMEDGTVVPVLVRNQAGYRQLCSLLTTAHLRSPKGEGRLGWAELAEDNAGLIALTGDEEGPLRRAWRERGAAAAGAAGERLRGIFGTDRLYAEIQRHLAPGEEEENEFLVDWARASRVPLLATNGVLHHESAARRVLDAFTCLRLHITLDGAGRALACNDERHLKPGAAMAALFADLPEAVANTAFLAERLEFTLGDLGYRFPDYPVDPGETQDSRLRTQTLAGARERYGELPEPVRRQLERELDLITRLGFSGYFLIVWDICRFARERGILIQGRGSAANSAVCYALGITAVDPVGSRLLFERFLSEGRTNSWPDIDLDLPSGERREAVLQELYRRYGRRGAAMTANVITYQGRSTMREAGKVLGLPDDLLDRFSKLFHHGDYSNTLAWREQLRMAGMTDGHPRLPALLDLCRQMQGLPRHLGQHSGGMILSAGRLDQFVPLENARMPGRSVVQWDKDDCEDLGIVKVDFLGLGMMAVLQDTLEICRQRGEPVDLARLPKDDPETYRMIQEADTIGIFQIESRAQMATLPRMKPATFYDLVIEVAIIRPGPIHGDAVNPYLERRAGRQPVVYPDPRAEPILERTLGVVLFQEQILRLAMELGGFSPAEADELRRAIGFTRSNERLKRSEAKLDRALLGNGVSREATVSILRSLAAFSLYGFPESHAISFALIAYASAWLKVHRPAAFYASLLNCQPMGFYSSASLVQDARRHGLRILPACVQESDELTRVEDGRTLRLGLSVVRGVRRAAVRALLEARRPGPFVSMDDFLRRTSFPAKERRILASAGALNALAGHRRAALWRVEEAPSAPGDLWSAVAPFEEPSLSPLERMTHLERLQADYATTSLTTGAHPMKLLRPGLPGLCPAGELARMPSGARVRVGGAVITRQRPGTAKGFCFITLEDETGHANAIVRPALFESSRLTINLEGALVITGRVQNEQNVVHLMAEALEPLPLAGLPTAASHDFH